MKHAGGSLECVYSVHGRASLWVAVCVRLGRQEELRSLEPRQVISTCPVMPFHLAHLAVAQIAQSWLQHMWNH